MSKVVDFRHVTLATGAACQALLLALFIAIRTCMNALTIRKL